MTWEGASVTCLQVARSIALLPRPSVDACWRGVCACRRMDAEWACWVSLPSPEVTTGEGQVTLHTGGACSALRRIDVAVLLEGIGRKDGMGRIDDCQRALGEGGLALIIVAFVGLEA